MTGMANYWVREGHDVTLITYSPSEDFYRVDDAVRRARLNLMAPSANVLHAAYRFGLRWWRLRVAIKNSAPDAVLSFMDKTNVLTLLACQGLRRRVVVAERTNPRHYPIARAWSRLRDRVYPRASAVVVQTESLRTWALARCKPERVYVIPNALDKARLAAMRESPLAPSDPAWEGRIVAMGRMTQEKGQDLLLLACAHVLLDFPRWRLELIGDGPLRSKLEEQARGLGIAGQVLFHGQLAEPFGSIKACDIFVLPSRIEGFPNVLLEAMGLGRACISFDCPCGPSDLIESEINGLLVPEQDVSKMALAIRRLIAEPQLRIQFGERAASIAIRYTETAVMQQWNKALGI